jgi:hypothetical protein
LCGGSDAGRRIMMPRMDRPSRPSTEGDNCSAVILLARQILGDHAKAVADLAGSVGARFEFAVESHRGLRESARPDRGRRSSSAWCPTCAAGAGPPLGSTRHQTASLIRCRTRGLLAITSSWRQAAWGQASGPSSPPRRALVRADSDERVQGRCANSDGIRHSHVAKLAALTHPVHRGRADAEGPGDLPDREELDSAPVRMGRRPGTRRL